MDIHILSNINIDIDIVNYKRHIQIDIFITSKYVYDNIT